MLSAQLAVFCQTVLVLIVGDIVDTGWNSITLSEPIARFASYSTSLKNCQLTKVTSEGQFPDFFSYSSGLHLVVVVFLQGLIVILMIQEKSVFQFPQNTIFSRSSRQFNLLKILLEFQTQFQSGLKKNLLSQTLHLWKDKVCV